MSARVCNASDRPSHGLYAHACCQPSTTMWSESFIFSRVNIINVGIVTHVRGNSRVLCTQYCILAAAIVCNTAAAVVVLPHYDVASGVSCSSCRSLPTQTPCTPLLPRGALPDAWGLFELEQSGCSSMVDNSTVVQHLSHTTVRIATQ